MSTASDGVPLDVEETRVLLLCVEVMLRLDSAAVAEEGRVGAEQVIGLTQGVGGVARLDRALAAARERLPVLRSLREVLWAHGEALSGEAPEGG